MAGQEGCGASLQLLAKPGTTALFLSVIQVILESSTGFPFQAALLPEAGQLLEFYVMHQIRDVGMERSVAAGSVDPWTP